MTAFPPVSMVTALPAPLLRDNIDTDAIIPSREIRSVGKTGLADGLFAAWRYKAGTREPDPAFILNNPRYANSAILLGGANFGCGSSREHAVWALHEYGVRVVIAPGFAPIFAGNAVRNGILPVVLDAAFVDALLTVDLAAQTVVQGARAWTFGIAAEAKAILLGGLDAIDLTLANAAAIAAWTARDQAARPWIYFETAA